MSLRFIGIIDTNGETSSLSISEKRPHSLGVLGDLSHGSKIRPKTLADAQRLVDWLMTEYDVKVTP